eukprot:11159330-Lingulodinium_polyedra.AAC.1
MPGPFTLVDDRGFEIVLTKTAPAMVKDLLVAGVQRRHERALVVKLGLATQGQGRRACVEVVQNALHH